MRIFNRNKIKKIHRRIVELENQANDIYENPMNELFKVDANLKMQKSMNITFEKDVLKWVLKNVFNEKILSPERNGKAKYQF